MANVEAESDAEAWGQNYKKLKCGRAEGNYPERNPDVLKLEFIDVRRAFFHI